MLNAAGSRNTHLDAFGLMRALLSHHHGTKSYMGGTTKQKCCRTTPGWNFGLSHVWKQYGNLPPMLQVCVWNVGPAGFWNGTREDHGNADDLHTLEKQLNFALLCARPSQSETLRLRSHRDMGKIKTERPTKCEPKNCRTFCQKGSLAAASHPWRSGKNWFVMLDSLSSHLTSGRPRLREGILSKFACQPVAQAQCPTIDDQDCSDAILAANWNWRLASCSVHGGKGKNSKATLSLWFIRRIVSNQSSPFTRTQPTIDRHILRCNTLMISKCTFVNANVCKLRCMAGVKTALKNFNRNFKLTCLFVSMVRCLLNFAQAIVPRCCNSTRPRCLRFWGMCLPRYLCEDPSSRTCTKSCDTSTYVGWSNGFVVNILLLAAFTCKPMWCSSHDKILFIPTKAGQERAYNIKSSTYLIILIFVNRSWWPMAMPWCSNFPLHFRKAYSRAALKSIGLRMSPCLTPRWISKRPSPMHRTTLKRVNCP